MPPSPRVRGSGVDAVGTPTLADHDACSMAAVALWADATQRQPVGNFPDA